MKILFKALRSDGGGWAYGDFVHINTENGPGVGIKDSTYHVNDGQCNIIPREVDPATVCQYIGKEDKNGKQIFSGDLIKNKSGYIMHVYFNRLFAQYRLESLECRPITGETEVDCIICDSPGHFSAREWQICGNIHDTEASDD